MSTDFHAPLFFDRVLDDPDLVRRLLEDNAPYFPVQRYFNNEAEVRASSAQGAAGRPMIVAPNFRGDWAYDHPLIDGVEPIFRHAGFREAAGRLFDSPCVSPFSVYSNITWQLPFDQGGGHIDVPEFRGVSRTEHPTWLLSSMGHSRLFEAERIQIATAVAWFYQGSDGGFTYWPDGPDQPPRVHEGKIFNTAVIGDNEHMFHRVRPVGRREDGMLTGMTLQTRLTHTGGDEWAVEEGGETLAKFGFERLRVSLSWKARVFRDTTEELLYHDHSEDLTIENVFDRFRQDLDARGLEFDWSDDPERDPDLVELLATTYHQAPSVFEAEPEAEQPGAQPSAAT
jgi:hypothetical protein